jgi:hypothetical protein
MLSLCLLSLNALAGVVGLVASYILIQRSAGSTGTAAEKIYIPNERKKSRHISAMNQFPVTVEEEIISKMLPSTNQRDLSSPEFKPVLAENWDAAASN